MQASNIPPSAPASSLRRTPMTSELVARIGDARRVIVAGPSGVGKTTLAQTLAGVMGLPHIEIDALYHGPDWIPQPTFERDVDAFSQRPKWITEWQYAPARPLLAERADLLVHLRYRRPVVMRRVILRTLRRRLRHERLWNGNVEPPLRTMLIDPEHIVRWSWTRHAVIPQLVDATRAGRPDLLTIELRRPRATEQLIQALREQQNAPEQ